MRDEYEITDTIQIVIEDEFPVLIADVVKWDMNVTFPADVLTCNLHQLKKLGQKTVIGDSTDIHSGAKIENSVVGDGVVIQHPIKITNTVIFPDTVVTSTENIDRFIVAPEHQIDCRQFIQEKNPIDIV